VFDEYRIMEKRPSGESLWVGTTPSLDHAKTIVKNVAGMEPASEFFVVCGPNDKIVFRSRVPTAGRPDRRQGKDRRKPES
jgi:hypothetical protein